MKTGMFLKAFIGSRLWGCGRQFVRRRHGIATSFTKKFYEITMSSGGSIPGGLSCQYYLEWDFWGDASIYSGCSSGACSGPAEFKLLFRMLRSMEVAKQLPVISASTLQVVIIRRS
jgi:hypothetical protein